ncbi:MAG: GNAT family N-acetyltransferase [Cyanobacteria bacterium P01_C01_bin.120]
MKIEAYHQSYLEDIAQLSLRAWSPVFESIQTVMDDAVYQVFYPEHWQVSQQKAVEDVFAAHDTHVWVALENDLLTGFVAVKLHTEDSMGEIYMIAVDPNCQGRGIGTALTQFAMDWMKEAGMAIAMVETGGDPGHAPARHTYEKVGFRLFPVARYFKSL